MCFRRDTKNLGTWSEASSCGLTSLGSTSRNMKTSRRNTCYCQSSIASTRSEDDQSTSRCEYLTRTMRRSGKENVKVLRDRNVINNKSPIKKLSPPVSPPTPVLSPDTLAALKNAEEIVRNAQEQITEASLFSRSISSRRNVRKHFDEPSFDDDNEQLLYIRELVASKFYEHQSGTNVEENVDTSKENLAKQQKLKTQVPRLAQPKFQPLLHPNYSRTPPSGRSPLRVRQIRTKISSAYRSPAVPNTGESPVKNDASSKTPATDASRKADDNYRAPRNLQVHVVPGIHIERKLSVRHLGNVNISPDVSLGQDNDNVRVYNVRHKSCVESDTKMNEIPGQSVVQPNQSNSKESDGDIVENRVDIVREDFAKPDEPLVTTGMFERSNKKVSYGNVKVNHVESTKDNVSNVTNVVQKVVHINVSENTKDQAEGNCPGQSKMHKNNRKNVIEEPLNVSNKEVNDPGTMQKVENDTAVEVDLMTRFINSFDIDERKLDEIQENHSDKKAFTNERYHMIKLRLKDIHRKYYVESKEESDNENSYPNVSLVDSTEESLGEYDIEEISLNKPSLSELDEILIAYDKVIRRINRDTDKVTEFLSDRNMGERNKQEENKTACSSNANPFNINHATTVQMKTPLRRKPETEVKNRPTHLKNTSNVQTKKTSFSNSSQSRDNLESVNVNDNGIVSSLSAFTDNPPVEEDSQSTFYTSERNTCSLSREIQKSSSNKSNKSSVEKSVTKESTIKDYSVGESVEEAYSVDDVSYKVGVSNDNDEGVHIVKSNENTDKHDSTKSQENSLDVYTSDFTSSVSATQKISSDNSKTKSSSYHLRGLMTERFRNEPVESQNEDRSASSILPQEMECYEENSEVMDNKTISSNNSTEKKIDSSDHGSNLASAEGSSSKKCTVDNKPSEADTENVQVAVVLENENVEPSEADTIADNNKLEDNQTLEHRSESLNSTISSIKASDTSHSATQESNINANASGLTSSKSKPLNSGRRKTISEVQESPGRLSSSNDSLRDCTSLQTSLSYTKSDKSNQKLVKNNDVVSGNTHKTESNASVKNSSGEYQARFESTRIEKEKDQRGEGHIYSIQEATIRQFLAPSSSISSSSSDLHCRSLSSTSVDAPSNARSEGELYMPSSCSYSLGEVRILGKSNSLTGQEALKSDSAVTIFVTRSILTSINDTENVSNSNAIFSTIVRTFCLFLFLRACTL